MELAISAVTGELVSRFVSFLVNKYHSGRTYSEEKQLERLQLLLLRARTVVEEADGRYITNSGMLAQLSMLAEAMYLGYWVLGAFRYKSLQETPMEEDEQDDGVCCSIGWMRPYAAPTIRRISLQRQHHVRTPRRKAKAPELPVPARPSQWCTGCPPGHRWSCGGEKDSGRPCMQGREDVDEEAWDKFCSTLASMDRGSKVIIISRCKSSEKLGTVKPIYLNTLSYEEFSYLFKTLTFGSEDPAQHPRLARIADELARELQSDWSLVAANLLADMMRRNLNLHFWLCVLSRMRRVVERNFSMFGEHPKFLIQRRHQVDVTDLLHPASPLRIVPSYTTGSSRTEITEERQLLPCVRLGDLVIDPGVRPPGDFNIISWESRVPPYTSFVHFVSSGALSVAEDTLPGRKRPAVHL